MNHNWFETIEKSINIFRKTGFWIDNSSNKARCYLKIFSWFAIVILFITLNIVYLSRIGNFVNIVEAVGMLPTMINGAIKTINFVRKKGKISKFLESLRSLIEEESWIERSKGTKLKTRIVFASKVFRKLVTNAMVLPCFLILVPICSYELPFKLWLPFNYKQSKVLFWSCVAFEFIPIIFVVPITITIEMFPIWLLSYTTGIIEELSERLKLLGLKTEDSKNTKTEDENLKELLKCIKIHLKIRQLTNEVSDIFGKVFWFQGFTSIVVLCATSFSLTVVRS